MKESQLEAYQLVYNHILTKPFL